MTLQKNAPEPAKHPLEAMIAASCIELFSSVATPLHRVASGLGDPAFKASEPNLVAGLGSFSGATMRGALILVSTFDFLASCRPKEGRRRPLSSASAGDWLYVRDWCKELANQLIGRIKRRVVEHGLTFDIGALSALTGEAARGMVDRQTAPSIRFAAGAALVTVWFDVTIMNAEALTRITTGSADGSGKVEILAKEGDIVLF